MGWAEGEGNGFSRRGENGVLYRHLALPLPSTPPPPFCAPSPLFPPTLLGLETQGRGEKGRGLRSKMSLSSPECEKREGGGVRRGEKEGGKKGGKGGKFFYIVRTI